MTATFSRAILRSMVISPQSGASNTWPGSRWAKASATLALTESTLGTGLAPGSGASPEPPDLASVPRPRVGYVGAVREWFHWELLEQALDRMPDASFVLIGDAAEIRDAVSEYGPLTEMSISDTRFRQ